MLEQLDPTRDQQFDPDGPVADRVLARALATPTRARPRVLVPVAAAGACAATVAVIALSGAGSDALGPQEALARAMRNTAAFDSGVASIHTVVLNPRGGISIDATHDIRFAPGASETTQRAAPGTAGADLDVNGATWRVVGGHGYLRKPGGTWQDVPDVKVDALAEEARAITNDRDLRAVVEHAADVTRAGDTYRATLSGDVVSTLHQPPFDIGAIHDIGDVAVWMTVKDDVITSFSVAYEDVTRTITYASLGTPQDITAPPLR